MAISTVPVVKAALVSQLQARSGLHDVQVTYGSPLPSPGREFIWVGDVEGEQAPAALGTNRPRSEDYTVQVLFSVLREGGNQQAADERCAVLFGELETSLRDDPTLGGAVNLWAEITDFTLGEFASDTAREARLTASVRVRTRI